jgi:hypothetical protein
MKSHRKALENVVCVLHNHADNHATNRVGTDQKQHQLVESSNKSVAALKFVCLVCTYVANNPEQFRSHVRQKHRKSVEAERGRFTGCEWNAEGARQYALCVCSADGTRCTASTQQWARDPAAHAWQDSLNRGGTDK